MIAKLKARLTAKAGPLPVWVWAALGLAALLAYFYVTKSGPFGSSSGGAADGGGDGSAAGDLASMLGGGGGAGVPAPPGTIGSMISTPTAYGASTVGPASFDSTASRGSSTAPSLSSSTITSAFIPGGNYEPAYASSVSAAPRVAAQPSGGGFSSITTLVSRVVNATTSTKTYNPVRARSSGSQAIA